MLSIHEILDDPEFGRCAQLGSNLFVLVFFGVCVERMFPLFGFVPDLFV